MSSAFAPRGTQLQRGTGALPGGSYVTIAEVIKIQRTGSKADLADVTNMDSPSGAREKLATLFDCGEISLECNFLPASANQHSMEADFEGQVESPWQIVLPNSLGTWGPFMAFVSSNDFDLPIDKQGTRTVKLTITGVPTGTV
jgi:predicted secreted protein